jgi:hypothetical protein
MIVFSSLDAARRERYFWMETLHDLRLHRVVCTVRRADGRYVRLLAFAEVRDDE